MRVRGSVASLLGLLTIVLIAAAQPAQGATPVHVCGTVTAYFVSDIPSGGLIEIDGKNYPIASSASYPRATPLPNVTVGTRICLDGTIDDSGRLLDFAVSPFPGASPSSSPAASTRTTDPTASRSTPSETSWPLIVLGAVAAIAVLAGALALGARIARAR